MSACHCRAISDVGSTGYRSDGETIHTPSACCHASLLRPYWDAKTNEVPTLRAKVAALENALRVYMDAAEPPPPP